VLLKDDLRHSRHNHSKNVKIQGDSGKGAKILLKLLDNKHLNPATFETSNPFKISMREKTEKSLMGTGKNETH
jgi:hypothetical protein